MTQEKIREISEWLKNNSDNAPFLFITQTKEGKSISIKFGDKVKIAEAIYTSIIANGDKNGVATEMYRIVKDVMLNLIASDDKYRRDFVKELMSFTAMDRKSES